MKHRVIALLLVLSLMLALVPAMAEELAVQGVITDVQDIQKYGNLVLGIQGSTLMDMGYAYGDIVTVDILGQSLEMPVGSNYSDVDNGNLVCRVVADGEDNYVILAINMGDLATTLGLATKSKIEEDPGFRWDYNEGVEAPVEVAISMKEVGGYADEYMIHQLVRTNERADYPDLTDEQFANFRNVATTGMGAGALYRSSSPVNPEIARNTQADAALNKAGVATIMNLADNDETMKGYEGFANSYYAQRNVIALNLGVDFSADDFMDGLADGMRFFAANEGPYLVHCNEGKDRAGFTSALLECLMGATSDEVIADYMVSYYNYYGVEPGTEQYDAIVRSNISKSLAAAFGVDDITTADLQNGAEDYLAGIGLSADEIARLKDNLSRSYED